MSFFSFLSETIPRKEEGSMNKLKNTNRRDLFGNKIPENGEVPLDYSVLFLDIIAHLTNI